MLEPFPCRIRIRPMRGRAPYSNMPKSPISLPKSPLHTPKPPVRLTAALCAERNQSLSLLLSS